MYRTPDEVFLSEVPAHHYYARALEWALAQLRNAPMGEALVIGSPIGEARALSLRGWKVTYLDIRPAPPIGAGVKSIAATATMLPFPSCRFGAVASSCVLCHVGTGRYGDEVDDDAPRAMLAEIRRVLVPGGRFALMTGPSGTPRTPLDPQAHRYLGREEVLRLAGGCGLAVDAVGVVDSTAQREDGIYARFRGADETPGPDDYLCIAGTARETT